MRHIAFITLAAWANLACSPSTPIVYQGQYGHGTNTLVLATGSPGELGLLRPLAEEFARQSDATILWRKAGSGRSLALLKSKQVDVVIVHAPAAEKRAVAEGWAANRTLIGCNEFYIVGPTDDPARIQSAKSATDSYRRIAHAKASFLSRGDNSGTHKKEMAIWRTAGVTPEGPWYVETEDFMRATLQRANAEKAYFMTDSSTWIATKKHLTNLQILFRGDPVLVNIYHALCQPTDTTPETDLPEKFTAFLASDKAQHIIGTFGRDKYGEAMYRNVAQIR
jgi:tungstate transport system substrate-binding protein